MSNIKILCDTINDVPKEVIEKYDIEVLPTSIIIEDKEYKAGIDLDGDKFYSLLKTSNTIPSTAQIPLVTYTEIFERYVNEGKTVLYLVGSSAASGTYQTATLAKNDIENGDIRLVDTYSLSIGGGILIKEVGSMVESGMDIDEIINKIESYKYKVHVYFSVNSLDHLCKGGRISGTKAAIGTILNIVPILKIEDGLVKQRTQVRGSKKVMDSLITQLRNDVGDDFSNKDVYIGYGDDLSQGEALANKVKVQLNPRNIFFIQIGSCVACHSGPSVLGLACLDI